jgi:signal transduction histidine kinase
MQESTGGNHQPPAGDDSLPAPFRTDVSNALTAAAPGILDEFESALRSIDSPLLDEAGSRVQVLTQAGGILAEAAEEIGGEDRLETRHSLAWEIGAARAVAQVHPMESLRSADLLFRCAIRCLSRRLRGERGAEQVALAASALHGVLTRSRLVAADSYVSVLLDRVSQAQTDERRRISRDLHDRIGHGIGVAQRDLELFEIYRQTDPDRAMARVVAARRGLVATLDAVRLTISELRRIEPIESLEKALKLFLDSSAGPDLAPLVEVDGDETRVGTETVEEVYLILRESLRNTIAHARARHVRVRVDIGPDELRASTVDDGRGFDPAARRIDGTGLISMRERTALLGGSLTLDSAPGLGTRVEIRVPLDDGTAVSR